MGDETKSLWAKFVEQPRRFFLWLAMVTLVLMAAAFLVEVLFPRFDLSPGMRSVVAFGLLGLVAGFIVWR
jgi:hypothetical protein